MDILFSWGESDQRRVSVWTYFSWIGEGECPYGHIFLRFLSFFENLFQNARALAPRVYINHNRPHANTLPLLLKPPPPTGIFSCFLARDALVRILQPQRCAHLPHPNSGVTSVSN